MLLFFFVYLIVYLFNSHHHVSMSTNRSNYYRDSVGCVNLVLENLMYNIW